MNNISFEPIGVIHTSFTAQQGTPIQPRHGKDNRGTVEIFREYHEGLCDLDGFSHIILLYHLHLSTSYKLKVVPYLDNVERGLFATRAPRRPNPIGLSIVRLEKIEDNVIHIVNIDMIDGTPLLDIKPYIPTFDETEKYRIGWLTDKIEKHRNQTADSRFSDSDKNNG